MKRLDAARRVVENIERAERAGSHRLAVQLGAQLEGLLVPVKAIAGELGIVEQWPPATSYTRWSQVIERIAGQLKWGEEIELNLQPSAPRLSANHLHPWVWDGARSLWDSGHFADAVLGAAKLVNARLQNKVGRRDISDSQLCAEAFSLGEPKLQSLRLRFPGDRSTESWKSRQQGALELSRGAFKAIRNPLAHTDNSDMDEQQALELLAVFSVIARWIDECEVERASQDS